MSPHTGLSVCVSKHLAGSKRGVRQGNTVYVSPAMYDLMKHADPDELKLLLEKIEVVTIPEMRFDLPMTTQPPRADEFARDVKPWRYRL